MNERTVKIVTIDGGVWYLGDNTFTHLGVSEDPKAILSNYIRGSRGPLIKAYKEIDLSDAGVYINANYILYVEVKH